MEQCVGMLPEEHRPHPSEPCATNLHAGDSRDRQNCLRSLCMLACGGREGHHWGFNFTFVSFCALSHTASPVIYITLSARDRRNTFCHSLDNGPGKSRWRKAPLDQDELRKDFPQTFPTNAADKSMGCTDHTIWSLLFLERDRSSRWFSINQAVPEALNLNHMLSKVREDVWLSRSTWIGIFPSWMPSFSVHHYTDLLP